ncbi:hypothetical protein C9I57_00920 [Trinickia symbiotica]|uniref:Uncharacterized protein n=1 Tax=Trinickia symbiotica TaxID=863227 RepID=A0A2T3Y0X5_9BURK|nr:hypothetical protein C9I57_00920 [Trinickia symbiotica]
MIVPSMLKTANATLLRWSIDDSYGGRAGRVPFDEKSDQRKRNSRGLVASGVAFLQRIIA